jgi:hypothetical protein
MCGTLHYAVSVIGLVAVGSTLKNWSKINFPEIFTK